MSGQALWPQPIAEPENFFGPPDVPSPEVLAEAQRRGLVKKQYPILARIWVVRAVVNIGATLSADDFLVAKHRVRLRADLDGTEVGASRGVVVEVELCDSQRRSVEEAYITGCDVLEVFLDRAAVVSYGRAEILQVIGALPKVVEPGMLFPVVAPIGYASRSPESLRPEHLAPFEGAPRHMQIAVHNLRRALAEDDAEHRLQRLYSAAESVARVESTEMVRETCPECQHTWSKFPATRNFIAATLSDAGVTRNEIKEFANSRGAAAHGGKVRELRNVARLLALVGGLEAPIVSLVARRLNVRIVRRRGVVMGPPITVFWVVADKEGGFQTIAAHWRAPARFTELATDVSDEGGDARVGAPIDPDVEPRLPGCAMPTVTSLEPRRGR